MAVKISRAVLAEICRDVARDSEHERCGLLLGDAAQIAAIRPARNVHPHAGHHFELDPVVLLYATKAARGGGLQLIGHYHSHPTGPAEPSATDAEMAAADGRYWLIVTSGGEAKLWRSVESGAVHGRFNPIALDICGEDCH